MLSLDAQLFNTPLACQYIDKTVRALKIRHARDGDDPGLGVVDATAVGKPGMSGQRRGVLRICGSSGRTARYKRESLDGLQVAGGVVLEEGHPHQRSDQRWIAVLQFAQPYDGQQFRLVGLLVTHGNPAMSEVMA